ncbi:MAG: hypothetical protein AAF485_01515 [Chloroflexota bacterium]
MDDNRLRDQLEGLFSDVECTQILNDKASAQLPSGQELIIDTNPIKQTNASESESLQPTLISSNSISQTPPSKPTPLLTNNSKPITPSISLSGQNNHTQASPNVSSQQPISHDPIETPPTLTVPAYIYQPNRYQIFVASLLIVCFLTFFWRQPLFTEATNSPPNRGLPSASTFNTTPTPLSIAATTATPTSRKLTFVFTNGTPEPTPVSNGFNFSLKPIEGSSGWVAGNESTFTTIYDEPNHFINEAFLYTGAYEGLIYHGGFQFDVSDIPRGTRFHSASVTLTGLRSDQLADSGEWRLHLLVPEVDFNWTSLDYKQVHAAPSWITFESPLRREQLSVGATNTFRFTEEQLIFLEHHHLAGGGKLTFRLDGPETGNNLFAWDASGGESGPTLFLSVGPPPEVTPDIAYVIITTTPTAENLETAVANSISLTAEAARVGTATPLPPNWITPIVVTPTPTAENEATAQIMNDQATAIALTTGEAKNVVTATPTPTYVIITSTPTPENVMTAAAISLQLTADATQFGAQTPLPKNYVTPIVVTGTPTPQNQATAAYQQALVTAQAIAFGKTTATPANQVTATPSPTYVVVTSIPTPETIATAAARSIQLTAEARQIGTSTALPPNWVTPIVVTTTPTPANQATADFRQAVIITTGTPTPSPGNVHTATPTAIFTPVGPFAEPTATVTPSPVPPSLPDVLLGKIVFLSNREGATEAERAIADGNNVDPVVVPRAYFFDPNTGEYGRLADIWPYDVAAQRDAWSADKRFVTYTADNGDGRPAIFWFDTLHNAGHQVSHFGVGIAYDGAWSPTDEQIAFVSTESDNDEIWTIRRDGTELKQLTKNTWEWDKHASWSPDGNHIVFYSNRTGKNQIWIMDKNGGNQRLLMPANTYDDWDPVWIKHLDSASEGP